VIIWFVSLAWLNGKIPTPFAFHGSAFVSGKSHENVDLPKVWLDTERLSFRFRPKLWRNRANEPRVKPKLQENRTDFPDIDRRFVEFEINQIVIAIDLISHAGNCSELLIQLQDFAQIPQSWRINF
jgi:hypothetical protein